MILSICIATIPERAFDFTRLKAELERQAKGLPVEIVVDDRPRGALSIGSKRQAMNEAAKGQYVVHIDDDDWVPEYYVPTIIEALASAPDCVGHYELVEWGNKAPQLSMWTNAAPKWGEGPRVRMRHGTDYVRTPFHKTPLKREHALSIGFKDLRFAEDHDFSQRLKDSGLCRTEVFVHRVLYYYRYKFEDHNTKFGIS